jgi:uracil-DNA glycosylase family 4
MPDPSALHAPSPPGHAAVAAWADWYVRMGVLDCVEEVGFDRIGGAVPATAPGPAALPLPALESEGVASARAVARACRSLDELEAALRRFEGCPLAETATHLCFADGDRAAPVMLVGEAPGAEEDRHGRPFSGPSGRLLDRMLGAVGLTRRDVYVTNVIYWRPPGNRSPTSSEIATCLPFLERQVELLRPRVLVSVGGVAARVLLDLKDGVTKLRGRRFTYRPADGGAPIPTLVMLHPAYLLRQPLHKRLAWRDMLQLRAEMRALGLGPAGDGGEGTP